jgi:hypothetical protein
MRGPLLEAFCFKRADAACTGWDQRGSEGAVAFHKGCNQGVRVRTGEPQRKLGARKKGLGVRPKPIGDPSY